jgi:hypothetical protein
MKSLVHRGNRKRLRENARFWKDPKVLAEWEAYLKKMGWK